MQREILTDSFSNETTKSLTVTMRDGEKKEIKPRGGEIFETVTARQFFNIPICAYRCIDEDGVMVRFYGYAEGEYPLKQKQLNPSCSLPDSLILSCACKV